MSSDVECSFLTAASAVALLGALACSSSYPPPIKPRQLTPRRASNIETVQVDGHRVEKFLLDRAVLRVPTSIALDEAKLASLLRDLNLRPAEQLELFQPFKPFQRWNSKAPLLPSRKLELGPTSPVLVKLPQFVGPITSVDALIAREPAFRGRTFRFSSEAGKRAFGYALQHARDVRASLGLEFVVDAAGLFNRTKEGDNFAGMHQEGYWALTKLRDMWPLVFAAKQPDSGWIGITVAVVDHGLKRYPVDMSWDYIIGAKNDMDKKAKPADEAWHGTHCGSVVGSAVNDGKAAAGTSLLSAGSQLPAGTELPPIRIVAAVMPPEAVTMPVLARAIQASVAGGADVVTASYSYSCGIVCSWFGKDQEMLEALRNAEKHNVPVVLGAGNEGKEMPNNPVWEYVVGCQRNGKGLCIGAVGYDGLRKGFSNWGASVVTFAPGFNVPVSALPSEKVPPDAKEEAQFCMFDGTSASAPFVAGIIALAEAAWGKRVGNQELRGMLAQASRVPKGGDVPILDASSFLRQKLVFRQDKEEPNNALSDVEGKEPTLPNPATVYTLDSDNDTDLFPLQLTQCTSVTVDMKYVADWEESAGPSALSLTILDGTGSPFAVGERLGAGTFKLSGATLKANQRYYLRVSNQAAAGIPKALPTAYDLNLTSASCPP